jgi:predicted Fe-S protein YdhL (DUF1289 family)
MGVSPKGELSGESESIEARAEHIPTESHSHPVTRSCVSGGNRASREAARWTKLRRGERPGVSESIEARVHAFHQESHTHSAVRTTRHRRPDSSD